jgi:hypothetical protein
MGMDSGLLLENYWHYPSRGAQQAHGGWRVQPTAVCWPADACLAMHQQDVRLCPVNLGGIGGALALGVALGLWSELEGAALSRGRRQHRNELCQHRISTACTSPTVMCACHAYVHSCCLPICLVHILKF